MATEGDGNGARTTNVCMDGCEKNRMGKKYQKGNEEVLPELPPSEALTSHPPLIVESSDKK